jgi:hypothetical protein
MQDYIVLDCHTETTLTMETTVRTAAQDPSIEDRTTALNDDDKENDPIPVDELGIYSELNSTTNTTRRTAFANPSHSQQFDVQDDNASVVPVEDNVAIYSSQDHQKLQDIQSHFYKTFPPSHANYYANPQALKALVLAEAQGRGFNVAIQGSSIVCGKHNAPRRRKKSFDFIPPHKRRKVISTRCACTFKIGFTLASRLVEGAPPKAIRITDNSNYLHSNGCLPSQHQLMSDKRSAGVYMKNLLEPQLHTILQLVEMRQAPALILRNLLRPLFPESYPIDSVVLSNVRYKARAILDNRKMNPHRESTIASPSESLELGQFVEAIASGVTSPSPLDELPPAFIDIASRHANELLSEILNEGIKDAVLIERYLEALHQKDPGFTYKIAIANDGSRCGYIWMTPAMRRSFELYGDVLFLDMMKRMLNSQHWPYVGPVVLNGNKKIEVAAEGILVTESIAAYDFVVKAMLEMAPNRRKESIRVICGDGIFRGGGLLLSLGITDTCFFVSDQYHLLQRDWPDYFKGAWFHLEQLFKNYIYSSSEAEVQSSYNILRQKNLSQN